MLLEEDPDSNDAKPFIMPRAVYKYCMDKEQIEHLGLQPLRDILKALGRWTGLEGPGCTRSLKGKTFNWYQQVYKFRCMGYSVDSFVDFSVTTDLNENAMNYRRKIFFRVYLIINVQLHIGVVTIFFTKQHVFFVSLYKYLPNYPVVCMNNCPPQ